jgi:hypothetical protein
MPGRLSTRAVSLIAAGVFVLAFRAGVQPDRGDGADSRPVAAPAASAIAADAAAAPARRVSLRTAAPLPKLHGLPQRRRARRPASRPAAAAPAPSATAAPTAAPAPTSAPPAAAPAPAPAPRSRPAPPPRLAPQPEYVGDDFESNG